MALIKFHQHAQLTGSDVRNEQLDGKAWLVAPCVAIVAGVLNGLLVPADEIEISTPSWNGRSVPVHHPNAITANEPMTIQNQVIGYFYQASFADGKLHGEMWLDVNKANALGGDAAVVIETIQNGGMVEVSTAYWAYTTSQAGEWNGVPYTGITTHILPDHVALLPGDEGACNINDGCGVPRRNQRENNMENEILENEATPCELVENGGELPPGVFKQIKNYVSNLFQNHDKERNMKDMVKAIIENGKTGMTEEQLKALPETAVTAMFNGLQLNETDEPEPEPAADPAPADTMPAWAAELATKFGELATKVDGLSATQNKAAEEQKAGLIKKLVANERVTFNEDELKAFTFPQLEKFAATFIPADYSGLFFGQNEQSEYEEVGLAINVKEAK